MKSKLGEIIFVAKRWFTLIAKRFQAQNVLAVYDDDLIPLLIKMGLKEKIDAKSVRCCNCNEIITISNIGVISNQNGLLQISCISTECCISTNNG